MSLDLHELADQCEANAARYRRLVASLEPFRSYRAEGCAATVGAFLEVMATISPLAACLVAFADELRAGRHAAGPVDLELVARQAAELAAALGQAEERLKLTLGPHGWRLEAPIVLN